MNEMQWPADKVERWPLARLVPYARNARTHSPGQVKQIAASMREWGWTIPVLADENGGIISGHGRVMAAELNGYEEVPVMIASGWSEPKKRAYVLADNKLALNAGWDEEMLAAELRELQNIDGLDLSLTGFDADDLAKLLCAEDDPRADECPDVPTDPVTLPGDLWVLGRHRVLCGDCRSIDSVRLLLIERGINLVFTSPPYAEQRNYDAASGFKPIAPDEYVEWFCDVAANIRQFIAGDGSYFLNIKPTCEGLDTHLYVLDLVLAHVRRWAWHFATEFCWERTGVPKSVTQRFKNQFEPVYQFVLNRWKMRPEEVRHFSDNVPVAGGAGSGETSWRDKQGGRGSNSVSGSFGAARKRRNGTARRISDIQGTAKDAGEYIMAGLAYPGNRLPTFAGSHDATGHAAAFPVGLPDFFIRAYTDIEDRVYDPFCGSGSTLIACEKTNRACYGMELSPAYCDVIVKRWQEYTSRKAVLDGDGRSFEELAEERMAVAV